MSKIHKEISVLDRLPEKSGPIIVRHIDAGLIFTDYVKGLRMGSSITHWLEEQKPEEEIEEIKPPVREIILDVIKDLVTDFTEYDRKEDSMLSEWDLNLAISNGEITLGEIAEHFKKELESRYEDN